MKTAHMFHHNDWDGKMSAAVMYQYFREARPDVEDYRFYEVDYTLDLGNDVKADFNPGDVIVFTDYSFSKESNVTWLLGLITHNNYEIKGTPRLFSLAMKIGCCRYYSYHFRTKINVKDVIGSYGWNSSHKRRQRHFERGRCVPPCRQEYD